MATLSSPLATCRVSVCVPMSRYRRTTLLKETAAGLQPAWSGTRLAGAVQPVEDQRRPDRERPAAGAPTPMNAIGLGCQLFETYRKKKASCGSIDAAPSDVMPRSVGSSPLTAVAIGGDTEHLAHEAGDPVSIRGLDQITSDTPRDDNNGNQTDNLPGDSWVRQPTTGRARRTT